VDLRARHPVQPANGLGLLRIRSRARDRQCHAELWPRGTPLVSSRPVPELAVGGHRDLAPRRLPLGPYRRSLTEQLSSRKKGTRRRWNRTMPRSGTSTRRGCRRVARIFQRCATSHRDFKGAAVSAQFWHLAPQPSCWRRGSSAGPSGPQYVPRGRIRQGHRCDVSIRPFYGLRSSGSSGLATF
jgi:hypothetical protein